MKTVSLLYVLILSTTLGLKAYSSTPNKNSEALRVLQQYESAIGIEKLKQITTISGQGTLVRYKTGKVPFSFAASNSGSFYYHQIFASGDQIKYGFDSKTAWVQSTKNVEKMDESQLIEMSFIFNPFYYQSFKKQYPKFSIIKKGEQIVTLAAISIKNDSIQLDFNTETGCLIRVENIYFDDYKKTGSIYLPYKIRLGKNQGEKHREMILEYSQINLNEPIATNMFQKPQEALQLAKAPLYKHRKEYKPGIMAMDKCVGTYVAPNNKNSAYHIFRDGQHLFLEYSGQGTIEILAETDLKYYIKFLGWEFEFIENKNNEITELIIKSNKRIRAIRKN